MNTLGKNQIHFHLNKVQDIAGFTPTNVEKGNYFWLLTKTTIDSDKIEFYSYIAQLSNPIFNEVGVFPEAVYQFLILIHMDLSADLYVNDFMVIIYSMIKRDVKKGEVIKNIDIADIQKVRFPNIKIVKTDRVVYCFKAGWKFGLFFDLNRELDIDNMERDLGTSYRHLSFKYVYDVLENETKFEEMIKDGWFPFIEIIGSEYKSINEAYNNKFHFEESIDKITQKFTRERIQRITTKWWNKDVFSEKKDILVAGINAFVTETSEGYINCIKNLLT
jgi:hypothetical protein